MAVCGERYASLIKAGDSLTVDSPFTKILGEQVPNAYDYVQWQNTAERMWTRAHDALTKLGEIETSIGKGYPRWNEIVPDYERARVAFKELPNVMFTAPVSGVPLAIKVAQDFACVLDLADSAISGYGFKPKGVGAGGDEDKWGWLWGLGAVAVVGGLVYMAEKKG